MFYVKEVLNRCMCVFRYIWEMNSIVPVQKVKKEKSFLIPEYILKNCLIYLVRKKGFFFSHFLVLCVKIKYLNSMSKEKSVCVSVCICWKRSFFYCSVFLFLFLSISGYFFILILIEKSFLQYIYKIKTGIFVFEIFIFIL